MKTMQNSIIIICACDVYVWDLDVFGKVRGLNNAVPTSIQKQAGIRPPRHTTNTQSSMKIQGYTFVRGGPIVASHYKERASCPRSQHTRLSLALEVRVP